MLWRTAEFKSHFVQRRCRRNKVRRNKNMPNFGKTAEFGARRKKHVYDSQIKLGNKLLVYISCCLAGRAYPLGDIPEDHVHKVKHEVFESLTCRQSKGSPQSELPYPYLRTLLSFDTREFLNVLALAFEEEEFNTSEGIAKHQHIVDMLLQIMVESVGFTPTQVGILFTFLARQMARHENTITVNKILFEQVLEFLCMCKPDDEPRQLLP